MKRELLKGLGLEKEAIDTIMEENGNDINNARRSVTDDLTSQIEELKKQIAERDTQLENLKGIDAEGLKAKIEELQNENKATKDAYENQISAMRYDAAIRNDLMAAEAKDIDMVLKLIDSTKVTLDENGKTVGLKEQIDELLANDMTKAFFGTTVAVPSGTTPVGTATPPKVKKPSEMSYSELSEFMAANPNVDINSLG